MVVGPMVNNSIAIIPARGGSKRLPRKNILDFYGKPLIAWTIEAALKSECFKYVLVSTENEEIADISIKYGAKVPFLRKKILMIIQVLVKLHIQHLNKQ